MHVIPFTVAVRYTTTAKPSRALTVQTTDELALVQVPPTTAGDKYFAQALGDAVAGDGRGGWYERKASSAVADGFFVVAVAGEPSKRWIRFVDGVGNGLWTVSPDGHLVPKEHNEFDVGTDSFAPAHVRAERQFLHGGGGPARPGTSRIFRQHCGSYINDDQSGIDGAFGVSVFGRTELLVVPHTGAVEDPQDYDEASVLPGATQVEKLWLKDSQAHPEAPQPLASGEALLESRTIGSGAEVVAVFDDGSEELVATKTKRLLVARLTTNLTQSGDVLTVVNLTDEDGDPVDGITIVAREGERVRVQADGSLASDAAGARVRLRLRHVDEDNASHDGATGSGVAGASEFNPASVCVSDVYTNLGGGTHKFQVMFAASSGTGKISVAGSPEIFHLTLTVERY